MLKRATWKTYVCASLLLLSCCIIVSSPAQGQDAEVSADLSSVEQAAFPQVKRADGNASGPDLQLLTERSGDNTRVDGRFVSFTYDYEQGTVTDYRLESPGEVLFDTISASGMGEAPMGVLGPQAIILENLTALTSPAQYVALGEQAAITLYDSLTGTVVASAYNGSCDITLATSKDFTVTDVSGTEVQAFILRDGGLIAVLAVVDGEVSGGLVGSGGGPGETTVSLQEGGSMMFRVISTHGGDIEDMMAIDRGLAEGTISNEVYVVKGAEDSIVWEVGDYSSWAALVLYHDPSTLILDLSPAESGTGDMVSGMPAGPVLVDIGEGVFSGSASNLTVVVNDEVLNETTSIQEVVDGASPNYYVMDGQGGTKVLMSLPQGADQYTIILLSGP